MNAARFDRALSVIGYLAGYHEGRSLSALAGDLGLPMSSTYDLLSALVEVGALRLAGSRTYALGPRAVRLGLVLVDSVQLHKVAAPHLRALAHELDENVYLGVRVGDEVVYADRYEVSQTLSVVMALGESRPLHGSASGKLLTAHDPELEEQVLGASRLEPLTPHTLVDRDALRAEYARIRERHYSVSDGESVEGIRSVATPIVDDTGRVVATAQITATRGRLADDRLPYVLSRMAAAAATVSAQLGATEPDIPDISPE